MAEVLPLPRLGDVFGDVRDGDRGMRISYHQDREVLVISLWAGGTCRATFQLAKDDAGRLSTLLKTLVAEERAESPEPSAPAP